jgi:hypothetical protein
MDFPQYNVEVLDQFGGTHYIVCNEYQFDDIDNDISFFRFGGGWEEVIEDGKTRKKAIMNFIGKFMNVAGFRVYEVNDETESRSEVR